MAHEAKPEKGKIMVRTARKALVGVAAMLAMVAIASPAAAKEAATANFSASPGASPCAKSKKALKKSKRAVKEAKRSGSANKLKRAKKKLANAKKAKQKACGGGGWAEGRYQGTYAENNVDLAFNVVGNRLYTGPFDSFFIDAPCNFGLSDQSSIEPVQAFIAPNGSFSGSGVWVVAGGTGPSGFQIPWKLSGQISGTSITNGVFEVSPYSYSDGKTCSGATHFTAQWYGDYIL